VEEQETETLLAKKPEDNEILELVDEESTYQELQSSKCAASPAYRCPYRRYKDSAPRKGNVEFLSEDTVALGTTDRVEVIELVDPDCLYPETQYSECTAPLGYHCAYRQYTPSPRATQVGMLHEIGRGLSHSQPLRLTPRLSRPGSGK
jgi:hypothetical protein